MRSGQRPAEDLFRPGQHRLAPASPTQDGRFYVANDDQWQFLLPGPNSGIVTLATIIPTIYADQSAALDMGPWPSWDRLRSRAATRGDAP